MSRKSRKSIIAWHIRRNLTHRLRLLRGNARSFEGSTHFDLPLERSLAYIDEAYSDYLAYASLSAVDLAGKRVLEIGPGDNLGIALRFLADGCSQVVCLDKFFSERDEQKQLRIYRALRERLSGIERQRFDEATAVESGFMPNPERLQYYYGTGIEDAADLFTPASFDYIISRAVLMEVKDSDEAFTAMDRLLKPGGRLIHKVPPLQDYYIFSPHGYHPLEFLTVPNRLYQWMVSHCGGPNRRPVTYYRRKVAELGYQANIHIVNLVGCRLKLPPGMTAVQGGRPEYQESLACLREIRPRIQPEFRSLSDQDLMIEDTFLVARKPSLTESRTVPDVLEYVDQTCR